MNLALVTLGMDFNASSTTQPMIPARSKESVLHSGTETSSDSLAHAKTDVVSCFHFRQAAFRENEPQHVSCYVIFAVTENLCPQFNCGLSCPNGFETNRVTGCLECECENICDTIECQDGLTCDPKTRECGNLPLLLILMCGEVKILFLMI